MGSTADGDLLLPVRTLDNIKATLRNAKLDQQDLQGQAQVISFGSNFSETELRLLELNDDILNSIKVGTRLVIRGGNDDLAVLCTDKSTYEIKEADTSNSLLIMNALSFPESPTKKCASAPVQDITNLSGGCGGNDMDIDEETVQNRSILRVIHSYYELRKRNPNLSCLHQLLLPSAFKGQRSLADSPTSEAMYYTLDMLLNKVSGSKEQVRDYIQQKMRCVELNGKVRVVDDNYLFGAVTDVLQCIEDNSWDSESIPADSIVSQLDYKHSEIIVRSIMKWFFCETTGTSSAGDRCKMNEYEICRFIGAALVQTAQKHCLKDFLKSWQESVPKGLKVNIKQLEGIALCDKECTPSVIWYFPEESLPDSVAERFMVLFQEKTKWRQDEIHPYIQNFVTPSQNASTLLTKYARVQTNGNVKFYISKQPTK